jgi:phosphoribosylformylglycinamidine synthase
MKARVLVKLKPSILDAQGASVKRALDGLGFHEVRDVRVGKVVDVDLDDVPDDEARRRLEAMCARLLGNRGLHSRVAGDGLLPGSDVKGRLSA